MKKIILLVVLILCFPIIVLSEEMRVTINIGDMGTEIGTTTTTPPPSGEIQASIEPSPASGKAPLTVKFDISKSHPSLGKTLDKYELDFNDGSAKKVGAWPSSVSSLTAIEHIYSKSSTAKLTVWEKGPDKTASATKQITITTGGGTVTPVEINNVLTGIGQIDKKFVDSLFK